MKDFYELKNGLRVYLKNINNQYSVNILVNIECGAFYPQTQPVGMAHMLEHNIFSESKGEKTLDEKLGELGTFAEANTYDFYTSYNIHTFKEQTRVCLELLLNKLFNAKFDESFFKNEKKIIYQEYLKQRNNIMPANSFSASEKFYSDSFISNSGYGIGTKTQINAINFDDMLNFYNTYYTMDHSSIVIVGNFDKRKILKIIKRFTYGIDNVKKKHNQYTIQNLDFSKSNSLEIVHSKKTLLSSCVELMFSGTNELDENKWSYEVLTNMLCGLSTSSIIKKRLRKELGIVYNSDASTDTSICYNDCGTLSIRYFVDNNKINQSILECFKCLQEIKENKYEDIFNYSRQCVITNLLIKYENIENFSLAHANELMFNQEYFNTKKVIKKISQTTYSDIVKCVDHMLSHKIILAITGSDFNEKDLRNSLKDYII